MMTDNYSNYSLTSLLKVCSQPQRVLVLTEIAPKIFKIAKNKKGTHCLQNLISLIDSDEEEEIVVKSLKAKAVAICKVIFTFTDL